VCRWLYLHFEPQRRSTGTALARQSGDDISIEHHILLVSVPLSAYASSALELCAGVPANPQNPISESIDRWARRIPILQAQKRQTEVKWANWVGDLQEEQKEPISIPYSVQPLPSRVCACSVCSAIKTWTGRDVQY